EIYKDREKRRGEEMAEELKKYKESPAAFAEIERRRSDTRKPSIEGYKELEYKQPPEPSEFPEVVEQKLKRWESVEDRFKRPDSMETPEEKKERYKKLRELFTKKPSP
ncbi:MAG: hypothetical protein EB120_12560, partial [Proteobacteria bacterium]|nr:hypothetical protein [Pseudomonadota bacterium]